MLRGDDDAGGGSANLPRSLGLTQRRSARYEAIGLLLEPRRTPAGYRCYGVEDRERLRFIAQAKAIGLSLQEISENSRSGRQGTRPAGTSPPCSTESSRC